MQETAQLLNLEAQILINCLTRANSTNSTLEDVGCEMDARQAASNRNTLCRTLYSRLFTWLVNKINETLKSTQREKNLALLDFYGFEVLDHNSFEQFAINYSAEKIHQVRRDYNLQIYTYTTTILSVCFSRTLCSMCCARSRSCIYVRA